MANPKNNILNRSEINKIILRVSVIYGRFERCQKRRSLSSAESWIVMVLDSLMFPV
jgi:hypothetical protein